MSHHSCRSKYEPLSGTSYIKLPKTIWPSKKALNNIQNIKDNECFKWCLVRHLHPADHNPARIRKTDKDFARELYFKGITFPIKIRDIHKIEKICIISICVSAFIINRRRRQNSLCFYQRLLHSCMIIYHITEEIVFAIIV